MPVREANAVWEGTLLGGKGRLKTETGACGGDYSAASRFETGPGTNPEELIGAAHAGCFSMALSLEIEQAGFTPESIKTRARVHLNKRDRGFAITRIELDTHVRAPGMPETIFRERAEAAKLGCPVSQLVKGAEVTLNAELEG